MTSVFFLVILFVFSIDNERRMKIIPYFVVLIGVVLTVVIITNTSTPEAVLKDGRTLLREMQDQLADYKEFILSLCEEDEYLVVYTFLSFALIVPPAELIVNNMLHT